MSTVSIKTYAGANGAITWKFLRIVLNEMNAWAIPGMAMSLPGRVPIITTPVPSGIISSATWIWVRKIIRTATSLLICPKWVLNPLALWACRGGEAPYPSSLKCFMSNMEILNSSPLNMNRLNVTWIWKSKRQGKRTFGRQFLSVIG